MAAGHRVPSACFMDRGSPQVGASFPGERRHANALTEPQAGCSLRWMRRDAPFPEAAPLTGTVAWFSEPRGYGFIDLPSGPRVYVHHSAIEMDGFRTLEPGMRVVFELDADSRPPRARHVVLSEIGRAHV